LGRLEKRVGWANPEERRNVEEGNSFVKGGKKSRLKARREEHQSRMAQERVEQSKTVWDLGRNEGDAEGKKKWYYEELNRGEGRGLCAQRQKERGSTRQLTIDSQALRTS